MRKASDSKCIIRANKDIKEYMLKRMDELSMTPLDVVKEANKSRLKITASSFSRWLNSSRSEAGILTQKQILWLCKRYGIEFSITLEYKKFDYAKCVSAANKFLKTYNTKY